jgi:hypothetical protein
MLRLALFIVLFVSLGACASKTRRTYPNNGKLVFWDMAAGDPGANVDTTGVTMYYRGPIGDTIEELGIIEAKVEGPKKKRADALRELKKEAEKLKADGICEIEYERDGDTLRADGVAFRFKNR